MKRKPKAEKKTKELRVALSPADRGLIVEAARRRALSPSTWMRALAVERAREIVGEQKASNSGGRSASEQS